MSTLAEDRAGAAHIKSLGEPIERVRTSPLYVMGLLVTAVVMALLPLIYVGLIGLVGYGVYYHATNDVSLLSGRMNTRVRFAAYAGPLVIGVVLLLFMVKPLFARAVRRDKRVSLVREHEAVLFGFVERLCEVIGAPAPRRIDVDCAVNASASLRRGLISLLGNDLVLTIGTPLVAGLTVRQFAGVLAHEFGHFSQGMGMRLSYVINRINFWFARVVYERDAWDERLVEAGRRAGGFLSVTISLAQLCVWLTRRVLWILMRVGQAVSCLMSRQMEYDADRFEVRVAGSEAFEQTVRRLHALSFASQVVHHDLWASWQEGRLADNFPLLVARKAEHCPPEVEKIIEEIIAKGRTGFLDTHPSDAARIARARAEGTEGVFRDEGPASALFRDFETMCKGATFSYYQELVGARLRPENLIPTATLISQRQTIERGRSACERYCGGPLFATRMVRLDPFSKLFQMPSAELMVQLKRASRAVSGSESVIRQVRERYGELTGAASEANRSLAVFKVHPKPYSIPAAKVDAVKQAQAKAEEELRAILPRVEKIDAAVAHRILCALAMLGADGMAQRIERGEQWKPRYRLLLDAIAALNNVSASVEELRGAQIQLVAMAEAISGEELNQSQTNQILRSMEDHQRLHLEIRDGLKESRYPYEHAEGEVSISRFAMSQLPSRNNLGATLSASGNAIDNLDALYLRAMGELAEIAEGVETALGIASKESDSAEA